MNILITGASGFLGSFIVQVLKNTSNFNISVSVRTPVFFENSIDTHVTGNISSETDWSNALHGKDVVIHTAGRVHLEKDLLSNPLTEYRKVNVDGTVRLANQASDAGVKRFIFLSSIKVNGEITKEGIPFSAFDAPAPVDDYAMSKNEAEQALFAFKDKSKMEIVVIRPPLIYGYGVKGNFSGLIKLISYGIPLPLEGINNRRSFVGLDNLVDLIIKCIEHPAVANKVIFASDGNDISTSQLIRELGYAMDRPVRLFPVPSALLYWSASLVGRRLMAQRLLASLQVDISETQKLLNWVPPFTFNEGLKRCFYPQNIAI